MRYDEWGSRSIDIKVQYLALWCVLERRGFCWETLLFLGRSARRGGLEPGSRDFLWKRRKFFLPIPCLSREEHLARCTSRPRGGFEGKNQNCDFRKPSSQVISSSQIPPLKSFPPLDSHMTNILKCASRILRVAV